MSSSLNANVSTSRRSCSTAFLISRSPFSTPFRKTSPYGRGVTVKASGVPATSRQRTTNYAPTDRDKGRGKGPYEGKRLTKSRTVTVGLIPWSVSRHCARSNPEACNGTTPSGEALARILKGWR